MGQVFISVAHSMTNRGVGLDSLGLNEYGVSKTQSKMIADRLHDLGHEVVIYDVMDMPRAEYLESKVAMADQTGHWDAVVEVHHNASRSSWQHGRCIYQAHNDLSRNLALSISNSLETVLPWRVRSPLSNLFYAAGRMVFVRESAYPPVIVEPGFWKGRRGDDRAAQKFYREEKNIKREAMAIADGIHRHVEGVTDGKE